MVDSLLPTAGSSILYGKPKKGKSSFARQLAVAVSQGKPFLGRDCMEGPVLYFALEEKLSEVKTHFELLGAEEANPILVVPQFSGCGLKAVYSAVEQLRPVLVIVDTLAKFLHIPKMNDYGAVNAAVRWLYDSSRATGAHFMGVMHAKKGKEEDAMDNLLGSTAFAGGVDTLIALTEEAGRRMVSTVQRYGEPLDETVLHFDPDTKSMALGQAKEREIAETKRLAREDLAKRVTSFVQANAGCCEPDVVSNVRGSGKSIREELRRLLDVTLRREGSGKSGDPFRYYGDVPVEK